MGICIKCGKEAKMTCNGNDKHPICSYCIVTLQSENGKSICPSCGKIIPVTPSDGQR